MRDPLGNIERHFDLMFVVFVILWLAGIVFTVWVVLQLIDILRQAVA